MRWHIIIPHKSPRTIGEHSQGNWYLQPTSTTLPCFNEVGCFPRMVSFKSQFVLKLDISLWTCFAVIQDDPKKYIYIYWRKAQGHYHAVSSPWESPSYLYPQISWERAGSPSRWSFGRFQHLDSNKWWTLTLKRDTKISRKTTCLVKNQL